MPLPTYILGPTAPDQLSAYPDMAGCELAENLIYPVSYTHLTLPTILLV